MRALTKFIDVVILDLIVWVAGLRVEQVQQNSLRLRQSAPKGCARVQIQRILPRLARQEENSNIQSC
jgi:hypothetical protein